jgi:hypothetical protein
MTTLPASGLPVEKIKLHLPPLEELAKVTKILEEFAYFKERYFSTVLVAKSI